MPLKRDRTTYGVLVGGVHLTYSSRAVANRVCRVLHAFIEARGLGRGWNRAEVERAAEIAAGLAGISLPDLLESCLNVIKSDARGRRNTTRRSR